MICSNYSFFKNASDIWVQCSFSLMLPRLSNNTITTLHHYSVDTYSFHFSYSSPLGMNLSVDARVVELTSTNCYEYRQPAQFNDFQLSRLSQKIRWCGVFWRIFVFRVHIISLTLKMPAKIKPENAFCLI